MVQMSICTKRITFKPQVTLTFKKLHCFEGKYPQTYAILSLKQKCELLRKLERSVSQKMTQNNYHGYRYDHFTIMFEMFQCLKVPPYKIQSFYCTCGYDFCDDSSLLESTALWCCFFTANGISSSGNTANSAEIFVDLGI